jgi:hypothetical protein
MGMGGRELGHSRRQLDADDDVLPGGRNYLVYCDESGIGGDVYYGFGSLWMPHERRGDFTGLVKDLSERFGYWEEIKWSKVNRHCRPFCEALVDEFFKRKWLMFHCLLVRKGYIDRAFHKDYDEAKRKHFAMLLKSKIKFFSQGDADKKYYVRVDPLPSRYKKADEAAHKIVSNQLRNELGIEPLKSLVTRDSKDMLGIQVGDLLLGAVLSDWQKKAQSPHKKALAGQIAKHLGWADLKADTHLRTWKFNIWHFHDPTVGRPREIKTRPVPSSWVVPGGRR